MSERGIEAAFVQVIRMLATAPAPPTLLQLAELLEWDEQRTRRQLERLEAAQLVRSIEAVRNGTGHRPPRVYILGTETLDLSRTIVANERENYVAFKPKLGEQDMSRLSRLIAKFQRNRRE